jgi:hypothetical protein
MHLRQISRRNSNGVDRLRCSVTQIFLYRLTRRLRAGAPLPTTIPPSHVAARSKRARRNVALHFWPRRHVLSTQWNFLSAGRAFDRDQRMLELWNNWYETLASMEALATVIVVVVVAAGVITLAERRRYADRDARDHPLPLGASGRGEVRAHGHGRPRSAYFVKGLRSAAGLVNAIASNVEDSRRGASRLYRFGRRGFRIPACWRS